MPDPDLSPDPDERSGGPAAEGSRVEHARRTKLARLRSAGVDAYPVGFARSHTLAEVARGWEGLAAGEESADVVRVAGRIVLKRDFGRLAFWMLRQGDEKLLAGDAGRSHHRHTLLHERPPGFP